MTGIVEIFVGLLLAVAVLGLVARKVHIPIPILFVGLRDKNIINDEVLRRIQRDIDLAEARLQRHQ